MPGALGIGAEVGTACALLLATDCGVYTRSSHTSLETNETSQTDEPDRRFKDDPYMMREHYPLLIRTFVEKDILAAPCARYGLDAQQTVAYSSSSKTEIE